MNSYSDASIRYGMATILRAILQLWFGTLQDYNTTVVERAHYGSWILLPWIMKNEDGLMVPVPATYIIQAYKDTIQERIIDFRSEAIKGIFNYTGYQRYMRRWTE